jgi:hypothetical protein
MMCVHLRKRERERERGRERKRESERIQEKYNSVYPMYIHMNLLRKGFSSSS